MTSINEHQLALQHEALFGNLAPIPQPMVDVIGSESMQLWRDDTDYSEKYCDDIYEYRRVTVPRAMLQVIPQGRTMSETEWRFFGITMSYGWEHYDLHTPEANVLLFRRVIGTDPKTGRIPAHIMQKVQEREQYIAELEHMRQQMMLNRSGPMIDQMY
jgi:cyclin-dependent kinase regulatory subunit CKS1